MQFEAGLSNEELSLAEKRFEFQFPPDLRALLKDRLPVGDDCPNWRSGPFDEIHSRLNFPIDGMLFDVEWSGFWWDKWGERPGEIAEAIQVAKIATANAPKLVPIYSHRYLPTTPHQSGLPVLSVMQTDIIVYYKDLETLINNYFDSELDPGKDYEPISDPIILRSIPFWGALTYWNQWGNQPDWDPGLNCTETDREDKNNAGTNANRKS